MKYQIVYTMTGGLGDYVVMGDLMRKVEALSPNIKCIMAHRANPHVKLWPYDDASKRFFNAYDAKEIFSLRHVLREAKREGRIVFGIQMAPGSLQGFYFFNVLKKLNLVDYIVDFNLINADVITPPEGNYILSLHLNQIKTLFKINVPEDMHRLNLPMSLPGRFVQAGQKRVGIHPWSRRGHHPSFVWQNSKWIEVIGHCLQSQAKVVVFGQNAGFDNFKSRVLVSFKEKADSVEFRVSSSVPHLVETVNSLDTLISVNTSVVHIAYALNKKAVILNGPSLALWSPKGEDICNLTDQRAVFPGNDRASSDEFYPSIQNISVSQVIDAIRTLG